MTGYQAVIGLEVHAQLRTRSKIFCGCEAGYGGEPNSRTCPVCLGHPGALPALNRGAVELAVRCALALECNVHRRSVFARKNYFYPDLPKGYQITQYAEPLATGGRVEIEPCGEKRGIGLERLHLEEDAGKLIHQEDDEGGPVSLVDLNRAGVPLVEIVSRPEIRTAEEAHLFLQRLRSIFRYTGVCDGNLEEGSMRCDANVSVRAKGAEAFGTRAELKNLNSFRSVRRALEYEIRRQSATLDSGGRVVRETRSWDARDGVTRVLRGKEASEDYRYFPEPDLPPLLLEPGWVEEIRAGLPELPAVRKARFREEYDLGEYEAHLLTLERGLADYYEEVARESGNPGRAANFILNDLLREQHADQPIPLPAGHLGRLIRMVDDGSVSVSAAREIFGELYRSGRLPEEVVQGKRLEQVTDVEAIREMALRVLDKRRAQVEEYRAGRTRLFGFLVGEAMKASGGRADPRLVNRILRELLGGGEG